MDMRNRRRRQTKPVYDEPQPLSLAEINLPVRVVNALEGEGVLWLTDLLRLRRQHLLNIDNFGEKTVEELIKQVKAAGFEIPKDWLPPKKTRRRRKERKR